MQKVKVEGALDGRCAGIGLPQRIEEILGRDALHVGRPVGSKGLRRRRVTLAAALDLVHDDTGGDNEEHAAQCATEGDQDHNAIGMMMS